MKRVRYAVGSRRFPRRVRWSPNVIGPRPHYASLRRHTHFRRSIAGDLPYGELYDGAEAARNVANAAVRMETYRELMRAAFALKRYQLRHGKFPETLAALTPALIDALPHDWMEGQPLKYRLRDDGSYLLYSVGLDGRDDRGDPLPEEKGKRPNFGTGRDIVWPQAAPEAL